MNRGPQTTSGVDRNLMTRMRENKNVQDFEHQSLALASDAELIQRGRERSNDNHMNTKIMQTQKVQFTAAQKKNWLNTQNDKRNRTVKELQFQLASEKLIDLKQLKDNSIHRSSQIEGIAAFEQCMIKNGLEIEDDIGLSIGISYESGEAFLKGIEERAKNSLLDDAENSKFVTRLKARTKERRAARIEKERRRRKVASDQSSVNMQIHKSVGTTKANVLIEDEDDSSGDENSVDLSSSQNKRKELAEESIRVFAEQSRMRYAEGNGPESLLNVLENQRQRAKEKSSATWIMCREVVLSFLNTIDYGEDMNTLSARGSTKTGLKADFSLNLLNRVDSELKTSDISNFAPSVSFSKDLASHDSWLSFAVLAANIGRWSLATKSVDAEKIVSALLGEDSLVAESCRESCAVLSKAPLFQESVRTVLEDLLEISCADRTSISLALNGEEQIDFQSASEGIILVLGGGPGCDLNSADLMRTAKWMGGTEGVELWDVAAAIDVGRAIAPLLEGKTPSVTYLALLDIFSFGGASALACASPCDTAWHEALRTVVLTPKAMKILADISDAATRITFGNKPHPLTSTGGKSEGKGDAAAPVAFFNNITFGILLGQTLWLRNYLKKTYVDFTASLGKKEERTIEELSSSVGRTPFSPFVIASRCVRTDVSFAESDHVGFALAVEWFLHGGTKEGLHDTAADSPGRKLLREAVAIESDAMTSGNKKGHEKATSKSMGGGGGGGLETDPSGQNPLTCIVRMASQDQSASHLHLPANILSSPSSKDFTDFNKDRVDDTLNTTSRLIVSNYSNRVIETQRPGTASVVDHAALEHVLIETAAGANIPYLQLLQSVSTADDVASATSLAPCHHSIIYSNGLSASETILSIALACKTTRSPGQAAGDVKDMQNIRPKVLAIMGQRRERLCVAERLWLLHISASNPIDLLSAHSAVGRVQESADIENELTGACILAYGISMSSLETEFRQREADMIASLKASESRFKDICLQTREKLSSSPLCSESRLKNTCSNSNKFPVVSSTDTSVIVGDCICMLGDVIDLRHIAWIDLAAGHRAALEESLASFVEVASSVSRLLADVLGVAHAVKLKSGMLVADLFSAAHHSELPFQLTYSGSRVTRRAVEVRKDRLRSASLLLSARCTSVISGRDNYPNIGSKVGFHAVDQSSNSDNRSSSSSGSNSAVECDPWKDFIHAEESLNRFESFEGRVSLHDSINDELRAEIIEKAICVLSALTVGVKSMTEHLEEHNRSVEGMIVSRYQYEHAMLKQWSVMLHDTLASSSSAGLLRGSRLSFDPFDVYDSDGADEVPYRVNSSAVELEDLTLSLHAVIELSVLLNQIKGVSVSNGFSEESCHEILMKCIGEVDSGLIPKAWQQDRKTRSLVSHVLQNCNLESTVGDDLCRVSMTSFVNALVTTLIMAAISSPPQTAFILRLGEIFGGKRSGEKEGTQFSFQPDKRPRRDVFREMIKGDNKLRCLWVEGLMIDGKAHTDVDMEDAVMAAAVCCEDAQGLVQVDQVMAMLCHSPPLIRSNTFQRALLLHALTGVDNGVASACDAGSDVARLLSFSSDGLCKALAFASMTADSMNLNNLSGSLTSSQYKWLLECVPAGLPPVNTSMFRPRFSLEDRTHRECVDRQCADGDVCGDEVTEKDESCSTLVPPTPLVPGPADARVCVSLSVARGQVARLVDVAVEVIDAIVKSRASRVPFRV